MAATAGLVKNNLGLGPPPQHRVSCAETGAEDATSG